MKYHVIYDYVVGLRNRDNPAETVKMLGAGRPRNRSSIPGRGKRVPLSLQSSDRTWGQPILTSNMCQGLIPPGVTFN
jgi:hypothetical protein